LQELLPCFGDGDEVTAEAVTLVLAVQALSAYNSCVSDADSVTSDEPLVQVAVPELVEALPITRTVSPAAASAAALTKVLTRWAKLAPVSESLPLLKSTYHVFDII
jgi:hypothetical protein